MARTLVLIRHAKAAPPDGRDDHGRPLADRGRLDAPQIGRWLRSQDVSPQVAVVSSARRTRETYRLLAAELADPPAATFSDDVYHAAAGDLLEIVRALPGDTSVAAVIGHNPGIGMLAAVLDDGASTGPDGAQFRSGFPTSSTAVFTLDGDWSALDPGTARLTAYTAARG